MKPDILQSATAPDFSDPIGLLRACHGRILEHCELLLKIPAHVEQNGIDQPALAAIAKVQRYFSIAAPLHHADEEQDLFPRLRENPELAQLIAHLRKEHRQQDALWHSLNASLTDCSNGRSVPAIGPLAEEFAAANRAHVEIENNSLLPAADALEADELAQIGAAMQQRRQG